MDLTSSSRFVCVPLLVYILVRLCQWLSRVVLSSLRDLPGPPNSNLVFGNVVEIRRSGPRIGELFEKYGKVVKLKGLLGANELVTIDTKALRHVLTQSSKYERPPQARYVLSALFGDGLLTAEGEKHALQRRILNSSFSPSAIKDLTPTFSEKARELCESWEAEIFSNVENKGDWKTLDVYPWLRRTSLDIIGLAGFHHQFNTLRAHYDLDSLNEGIKILVQNRGPSFMTVLKASFPVFRIIPDKRSIKVRKAQKALIELGEELLAERRKGGAFEKGKDLLSVLVRANTEAEMKGSQRMSKEDVLSQIPTFIVAGYETTSSQLNWALFALARYPDIQNRLRNELRSVSLDTPSAEDLSSERLPFLEMVVRETLRLYGVLSSVARVAAIDDVIPVEEPYVDRKGRVCSEIRIKKGEGVVVPIVALNRAKHIWGEDAEEFKPDRWSSPPVAARNVPGIWANLLTFTGGPRSCIGFQFALTELKVILSSLIRKFEFSLAVPAEDIEVARLMDLLRPSVRGEDGVRMPLKVKLCEI